MAKSIFLDEVELKRIKERALWLYQYEQGCIEQAWMAAFNEFLAEQGIEMILVPFRL